MDLGLSGKKAIVCAASKGLGCACAFALAREDANLIINARSQDTLEATAKQIRTDRLRRNLEFAAKAAGHSAEEEALRAMGAIPAGRFGEPEEFGSFAAFLCSAQAGYLTGQNIVLDGGSFSG